MTLNTKTFFVGSQEDVAWQTLKVGTRQALSTSYLAAVVPLFSDSEVWRKSPESDQIKKDSIENHHMLPELSYKQINFFKLFINFFFFFK